MTDPLPTTKAGPGLYAILERLWRRRIITMPWHEHAREMSDHYNGRIVVPMPELDAKERPAVANLIAQNLDQHSMRVASVPPAKEIAAADSSKGADKVARKQMRVLARYDQTNQMNLFDRRRARWLSTWASAPVFIRPDPVSQGPVWELRNPLGTYPAPVLRYDDMRPTDTIYTYLQTWGWLRQHFPQVASALDAAKGARPPYRVDDLFELVEYVDEEVSVLSAVGTGPVPMLAILASLGVPVLPLPTNTKGQTYALELLRTPNLAEINPSVVANRITLDGPKGLADDMVGIFQMEAKMLALHVNAVARAIYPDTWFVEGPQGGEIVTMADGLTGVMGRVRGGTIQELGMTPGAQTMGAIQMLERNQQVSGAYISEYGGESSTNVRTAQRGINIASNAISFYIQEDQEVIARSKQHEYEIAAAIDKAYFGKQPKSFYVSFGKERGHVDYTPSDLWSTIPEIDVRYYYAGMDVAGITNLLGQKLGEGTISRETAMRYDPYVYDVEAEIGRITADRIAAALEAGFDQQVQSGAVSIVDAAAVYTLVKSGDYTLAEAIQKVQQQAQTRQASNGAPGTPAGPVAPGSPAAQVGLQAGPGGAAQPVQPPNPAQLNLRHLIQALNAHGGAAAPAAAAGGQGG